MIEYPIRLVYFAFLNLQTKFKLISGDLYATYTNSDKKYKVGIGSTYTIFLKSDF